MTSITVFALAVEVASRLAGYGGLEMYDPDPEALWVLRPNQRCRTKVGGHPVRINAYGYRDDAAKLDGAVFVFGDSVTYGWGVAQEDAYPQRLEALVGREVVNAGINAYGMFQEEIALRRAIRFHPSVVIVAQSFNDSWQDMEVLDAVGRRKVLAAVFWKNRLRALAAFHVFGELQLRFVYNRLRGRLLSENVESGLPERLIRTRATLERIIQVCRENRLPLVLLALPTRSGPDDFHRQMVALGREAGVPVVAIENRPPEWFLPGDDVHPRPEGHAEIARLLADKEPFDSGAH